jgi:hypothetical protein
MLRQSLATCPDSTVLSLHVLLQVTKKFGKGGLSNRVYHKPYMLELLMALLFFGYAFAAVWYGVYVLASFCWIMAWTFVMISFGEYLF